LHIIAEPREAKKSAGRLRMLNPAATSLSRKPLSITGTILVFLVKCAICILLVLCALQWRADHAPAAKDSGVARHQSRQKAGGLVEDAIEQFSSLIHAGGDALAGAARDKCSSAPRDCLSAAQRLQSVAGRGH
jgi:hypothetical protein